jgi:hypothetical protein
MPSSTFTFTRAPYGKDDVPLASLIEDKYSPDTDALRDLIELKEEVDYSVNIDENFHGRLYNESNGLFRLAITRLFKVLLKAEQSNSFEASADVACVYKFQQPKEIFNQLCKHQIVRD